LGLLIAPPEFQAAGLDEADVRALLEARYIEERMAAGGDVLRLGEGSGARRGVRLALTEEGLARIADAFVGYGHASGKPGASNPRPQWVVYDGGGGELRLGEVVLKRVRHDSLGQRGVLAELDRLGWPGWIPSPLPCVRGANRKKALRDAVRRLNEGQKPLRVRFHVHDGGIRWETVG
jgi:hypothetical protein